MESRFLIPLGTRTYVHVCLSCPCGVIVIFRSYGTNISPLFVTLAV
jgi:hypothetical protein